MKILILTQYFSPENFRINDFAVEFKRRGHDVSVLTGIPNYPNGKFYDGYGFFKKRSEFIDGIKVLRAPLIPRGSGSRIRLAINYFSFVVGAILTSLKLIQNKFDIVFVFEPSPITVCLPAIFIKKVKKIPICFWVLDLWPESVVSAGNLNSGIIIKVLNPLVKYIYNESDKILVSSRGFINSIEEKGIQRKKIDFFPQWAETLFKPVSPDLSLINGVPKNSFKIMFAGNIGEAQDFPSILETAKMLKSEQNINWIILGGGRKEQWVKNEIKNHRLEKCFHMLGNFPLNKMPEFYANADCMLFSLKREYIFSITIPAKVQSYLACAKPVLAMIDGEASKTIEEANAGLTCPSESPDLLAENIKQLSSLKKNELEKLGQNALNYYKKEFERTMLMDKMENIFSKMTRRKK